MKYIFVTGGVVSGLGKGIVAASLGRLLKNRGLKVAAQKFDPYMNIDPGTMNPIQHGEVFVTEDGAETDLDLGHYERFIDENLTKYSNLTSGKVYWKVLNKERNGEYNGQTVQIIPHVTNEIKYFIKKNAEVTQADIMITEIGGTIGDIESQPFLEAIRQFALDVGRKNCLFIHVCLVPFIAGSNEYKSKPTQHSVKELQSNGIHPDMIIVRSEQDCGESIRKKIALFCNVEENCVIQNSTMDCLYEVPLMLHQNKLDEIVCDKFQIHKDCDMRLWEKMIQDIHSRKGKVLIGIVGKYVTLHDSYLSVVEALNHASYAHHIHVEIKWIDSETINENTKEEMFKEVDGILIPGGFGIRGIDGMIQACQYAREKKIPYFGICLGMQIAVIEFARNVAGIQDATSGEFSNYGSKVIDILEDKVNQKLGGTMRLGAYSCNIEKGSKIYLSYQKEQIEERHRHRYEFNNQYRESLIQKGLWITGTSMNQQIVETIEMKNHPFFIGVQFHPEFKSRPNRAHPLFYQFIKESIENKKRRDNR